MFGVERKNMKVKRTTKNGYAISKNEAVEAPRILMAERIKKLAPIARTMESIMSGQLFFPEFNKVFIELSKNTNGNIIIAVNIEFINNRASGERLVSIFWSIA